MPRIYPRNPNFRTQSEQDVFEAAIREMTDQDVVFCNLELSTPDRGEIEIDLLLLLADRGCVIVETKGGHITFDGVNWIQSDQHGSRDIYPAQQATKNMFSVRDYIRNRWSQGNLKADWIVAFPGNQIPDVNDKSLPRWKIVDKSDLPKMLSTIKSNLDNLNAPAPSSEKWIEAFITHLQPRSATSSDREVVLAGNHDYIRTLTRERAKLLEQLSENDRYYVRGPAGSGKTWLAFEQAKRWAAQELRVGVVTFNRGITTYMQNKTSELDQEFAPAWVGTFHNFANFLGTTAGGAGKYDEDNYPHEEKLISAALNLPDELRFDAFVVDEAQDFMSAWWKTLDLSLKQPGLGKFALFGDDQQNLFGTRTGPEGFFARFVINENIRNSRQIGELASGFTNRSITVRGPNSFAVEFVICHDSEVIEKADDTIEKLTDKEFWQPGEIALLTTKSRHPVHADVSARDRERYWDDFWNGSDVFYGTVSGFKGLERPVVVLAINGFHHFEELDDFLYVGLTRARDKLIIVCNDEIRSEIQDRVRSE
jgi:hypothetical protein